jgi:hypothetical protein
MCTWGCFWLRCTHQKRCHPFRMTIRFSPVLMCWHHQQHHHLYLASYLQSVDSPLFRPILRFKPIPCCYQKNTTDIECLVLNFLFWRWSFLNSDAPVSVIYFSVGPLIVPMHQNYVYFNLTHPSDRCYRLDTPDKTLISLPGWPQAHASKLPFQFAWILQCMAHSSFR